MHAVIIANKTIFSCLIFSQYSDVPSCSQYVFHSWFVQQRFKDQILFSVVRCLKCLNLDFRPPSCPSFTTSFLSPVDQQTHLPWTFEIPPFLLYTLSCPWTWALAPYFSKIIWDSTSHLCEISSLHFPPPVLPSDLVQGFLPLFPA